MLSASVVICTHDRAQAVGRAVEAALAEARQVAAEVLVIDNASTDDTSTVLAALGRRAPELRAMHEPVLGLSAARNRALAEMRGLVVAFLDDDAVPRPGWLAALLASHTAPSVVAAGGRIALRFETPPPTWLVPALHPALSAYDMGDEPHRLCTRPGDEYPYGGNISFRADAARQLGGFSTRLGVRGRRQLAHEETDLCRRLDQAGGEIRYVPDAVVDHWVFPERLRPAWFIARATERGRSQALFELRNRGLRGALGVLRWHHARRLAAPAYRPREPIDPERLVTECRRREAIGYLAGLASGLVHLRALRGEAVGAAL
jgi:glycosyltransferase involved in cell wall biosynthesis